MIWFISDTHYSHKNIVKGESSWSDLSGCRDFPTLTAHDDWLVNTINAKVARQDTLWHLGDWSFGGIAKVKEFRDRLNCERIHVVLGNHDHHLERFKGLFESLQSYKELAPSFVLCHYPIESWNNMERGVRHLHGHVHGAESQIDGRVDVGVDAVGLISMPDALKLPLATTQRHSTIEGGNKFAY